MVDLGGDGPADDTRRVAREPACSGGGPGPAEAVTVPAGWAAAAGSGQLAAVKAGTGHGAGSHARLGGVSLPRRFTRVRMAAGRAYPRAAAVECG